MGSKGSVVIERTPVVFTFRVVNKSLWVKASVYRLTILVGAVQKKSTCEIECINMEGVSIRKP